MATLRPAYSASFPPRRLAYDTRRWQKHG